MRSISLIQNSRPENLARPMGRFYSWLRRFASIPAIKSGDGAHDYGVVRHDKELHVTLIESRILWMRDGENRKKAFIIDHREQTAA